MLISTAQQDLGRAYVGGGPGAIVSGFVWLAAASVQHWHGVGPGFTALFFGGMLIYPGATLLCRTVFRRERESPGNPFGVTVLESTIAMIGGFFAAWLFLPLKPELVFPLAAIAVGTHYFVFKTVYGDRSYWLLASVVAAVGFGDIFILPVRGLTAVLVSVAELAFGLAITVRAAALNASIASATDHN